MNYMDNLHNNVSRSGPYPSNLGPGFEVYIENVTKFTGLKDLTKSLLIAFIIRLQANLCLNLYMDTL